MTVNHHTRTAVADLITQLQLYLSRCAFIRFVLINPPEITFTLAKSHFLPVWLRFALAVNKVTKIR